MIGMSIIICKDLNLEGTTDHNVCEGLFAAVQCGKQKQIMNVRNVYMEAEAERSQTEGRS